MDRKHVVQLNNSVLHINRQKNIAIVDKDLSQNKICNDYIKQRVYFAMNKNIR